MYLSLAWLQDDMTTGWSGKRRAASVLFFFCSATYQQVTIVGLFYTAVDWAMDTPPPLPCFPLCFAIVQDMSFLVLGTLELPSL